MAISTISITQGSGTSIVVDTSSTGDMQVIKLGYSTLGSTTLVQADANGLLVNLGAVSASGGVPITNVSMQNLNVAVVGTVTVSGTVAVSGTAAVTQSGTWNIGAVTSITDTVTVSGTVAISGTAAVTQSGTWNIGTVATITNAVTVTGTVALSGTSPVSGTVTANQGTAAVVGSGWYVRISDGTHSATLQSVSGTYCVPVTVLAQTGGGYSQQDKTGFTEGTTFVEVIGGVYDDSFSSSPSAGQASVLRITAYRAAHVNLRNSSGAEIGTSGAPVRTDPVGTTAQPVNVSDSAGSAINSANPLNTTPAPNTATKWRQHVAYTASQTAQAIRTPTSGKTTYLQGIILTPTTGGPVTIYDGTDGATAEFYNGTPPAGVFTIAFNPAIALAAVNNVLRYTTGSAAVGDLLCWGYEQ